MHELRYSFIIPTVNEEFFIAKNLTGLKKIFPDSEIIVVDGGSTDKTLQIAKRSNVKIIKSKTGRGIQLNEGVKTASGNILCFLHADTFLPVNAKTLLDEFFSETENKICRMKLGFDIDNWLLNRYKYFSKYDSVFTRFGDMFIAVRKNFYNKVGNFCEWNIFEDVDFLNRASKVSKVKILNTEVVSSARAFIKYGIIRQQLFNASLMMKFLIGMRKLVNQNKYYSRRQKVDSGIIIFARYPTEGKVKTRLAATLGNTISANIYKKIAENIFRQVKGVSKANKYIFYSDLDEKEKIKKWIGNKFFYTHQTGDSLGVRMKNAFQKVFSQGNKKVVIVGSDIPDLSKEIIQQSLLELNNYDFVIGPSNDGGYYLLGMKNFYPQVFEDIQFSRSDVFEKTIQKISSLGLTYTTLQTLQDIDTESDLINWFNSVERTKLKNDIELIYNLNKGRINIKCVHCSQF